MVCGGETRAFGRKHGREKSGNDAVEVRMVGLSPRSPICGHVLLECARYRVVCRLDQAVCLRFSSWALPMPLSQACPIAAAFSISARAEPIARQ